MKKKMLGVFTVVICFVTIVMSFAFAYESREEAPIDMARYDPYQFYKRGIKHLGGQGTCLW